MRRSWERWHIGREVVCPDDGQPQDDGAQEGTQLTVQMELLGLTGLAQLMELMELIILTELTE